MIRQLLRAGWLSILLYFVAAFFLLFQGGKTSLMLFVILNALIIYLVLGRWSGVTGAQGTRFLDVGDSSRAILIAGMRLKVKIKMYIPGVWPLPYIIVKEKLVRTTGTDSQVYELSFIPDYRRRGEISYETAPLRRGRYQFHATDCSTRDIFGLFEHRGSFTDPMNIQVLPRTIELKDWNMFRRSQRGVFQHTLSSLWARETTQIDGVREYIHGDRLSRVHWNATAKTGQWKSKEFEREALPRVVFVLDRNREAYKSLEQFELAVSVAASLLQLITIKDMPIGFVSAGQNAMWFGEDRTIVHREHVLQHLIDVEADGTLSMGQLLCEVAERFEPGIQIVMIGASIDEDIVAAINALESHRMVPSVIHIGQMHSSEDQTVQLRKWQRLCESKQWDFCTVSQLENLPRVLGVAVS
ncbi:MAG: DUF58 domain-containing protein [Candidatus Cohnella colombiensis]|uniref:DUF58 domain-containing protein n=1 Tax=Candidatus Cohnella colombiensis TaxID=3121368 RepID=A0AA95EUG9_9BACL|nr:MAG: DUF58 domain-containing protein [Cohnella sp.]